MLDPESIPAIVESIDSRNDAQTEWILSVITRSCWPRGPEDRLEPSALEWLRRWAPKRESAEWPDCSCAVGRCRVCN